MGLGCGCIVLSLAIAAGCGQTRVTPSIPNDPLVIASSPTPALVIHTASPSSLPVPTPSQVLPTSTPTPSFSFHICSPLAENSLEELPQIVSSPYTAPPPGHEERHEGVDFSYYRRKDRTSIQGEGVQSVLPGRVAATIRDKFPYGNMVIVETPGEWLPASLVDLLNLAPRQSLYLLYAHMEKGPEVSLGDRVDACQALGTVGKTGNAGVAHLHLETRAGPPGAQFPDMAYYGLKDSEEEHWNYVRWRTGGDFNHFDPLKLLVP